MRASRSKWREAVPRLLELWRPRLGLDDWALRITWDRKCKDRAYCVARPEYREATLGFNVARLEKAQDDPVVHELLHCHVHSVTYVSETYADEKGRKWSTKEEEALTTLLTGLFLRAYGRENGR
jgi:hypothetical protein